MIPVLTRDYHLSSGANRPSDIAVTVDINDEFNLMAVNTVVECFSRDLVPKYFQGLQSSVVYTAPPFFVTSIPGCICRTLPGLPLHMNTPEIIATFIPSKVYIWLCLPKALTLTELWCYIMFWVLLYNPNLQMCGLLENSQDLSATRQISVLALQRDSSQGGSSVASTINGQNSTPSSPLNNSQVPDITYHMTSTLSATHQRPINTPTSIPGISSHCTPGFRGTSQTDSKSLVVSICPSGIVVTSTPLSGLENLPTPITNPEAHSIITIKLQMLATENNQSQRQWQPQRQVVFTPRSILPCRRCNPQFGHWDVMHLLFGIGRLLELYLGKQTTNYECQQLGEGRL